MSVNPTLLTSVYDNADKTDAAYVTASVSPTANRWLVVDTAHGSTGATTVSGLGLSWTQELSLTDGGAPLRRQSRWYAWTGDTPGSGTISILNAGFTNGCAWSVYELGPDVDTNDPFVQTVGAANVDSGVTSLTVTLSAFGSGNNRPLIAASHAANEGSTPDTTPSAYTELSDVSGALSNMALAVAYNANDTDTSPSYSWATNTNPAIAIASEIKAAAAGGTNYERTPNDVETLADSMSAGLVLRPPDNLQAVAVSPSQINLSWDEVGVADSYDIEREGTVIETGYTGTHSPASPYQDTGRDQATEYDYRVRSRQA